MPTWIKAVIAVLSGALLFLIAMIAVVFLTKGDGQRSAPAAPAEVAAPQAQRGASLPIPIPGAENLPQLPIPQLPAGLPSPGVTGGAPQMGGPDVLVGATDVESARLTWAPGDPYCARPPLLTDTLQSFAHGITEAIRSGIAIPAAQEMAIGNELYRAMVSDPTSPFYGTVDTRPDLVRYITEVAAPLLEHRQRQEITYTFHIVDQLVVNAFAIPGGHIFFYTGLLMDRARIQNEAQVAGILAHEMGHIDLRHTTAAYDFISQVGRGQGTDELLQVATALMEMPYSNEIEDAADAYAVRVLFETQYSPLQFEAQWRAWDALGQPSASPAPPAADPLSALVVQMGREVENLFLSHSPDSQRACHTRALVEQHLSAYPYPTFYVGRQNLATLTARSVRRF